MHLNSASRSLLLAVAVLAAGACQKTPPAPAATGSPSGATSTTTTTATATSGAATAATAPAAQIPRAQVCSLLSAADVGAIMGKTLVQSPDNCSYGLDPSAKEAALAKTQQAWDAAAKGGNPGAMLPGMQKVGRQQQQTGAVMMDQMEVSVDAHRDDQTEEAVKELYAKTGKVVHGTLAPEQHGLNGFIEGMTEVSGVGDWAFATNIASVNMGMGFTIRGRILEARKGPWHVTVSATVSPDPGVTTLDDQMARVARALIAKLEQS